VKEGRKRFFFEKKNQKTFIRFALCSTWRGRSQANKSFCLFFQKEVLASFGAARMPPP
jgi:hypothetical protein